MEVSGEIEAPAVLSPGKESPVGLPIGDEVGWAQERKEKNPCPCRGLNAGL
jgi:hypothetical protein